MIGNPSFTKMAAFAGHAMATARALAGAFQRSSVAAALKNVCNRLVCHASSFPPENPTKYTCGGAPARLEVADDSAIARAALADVISHQVLARGVHEQGFSVKDQVNLSRVNKAIRDLLSDSLTSKKLVASTQCIKTLEGFESQLGIVISLSPKWQNEPLDALGRQIHRLPEEDQLQAIKRFHEAVEALPAPHRHGLLGMFEAAGKFDRAAFVKWENSAFEAVRLRACETDAMFSHSLRKAVAAMYGLKNDHTLRALESRVMFGPAMDLLKTGSSTEVALKKHDVRFVSTYSRARFDRYAFDAGPAKREMEAGVNYLVVAEKYGIHNYFVQRDMKAFYVHAYHQSTGRWPEVRS